MQVPWERLFTIPGGTLVGYAGEVKRLGELMDWNAFIMQGKGIDLVDTTTSGYFGARMVQRALLWFYIERMQAFQEGWTMPLAGEGGGAQKRVGCSGARVQGASGALLYVRAGGVRGWQWPRSRWDGVVC